MPLRPFDSGPIYMRQTEIIVLQIGFFTIALKLFRWAKKIILGIIFEIDAAF